MADVGRDQIIRFVDELRQAGDDFDQFVNQQLDHLESLQARIVDREGQLEADRAELRRQLDGLGQSQQRLDEASAAAESAAQKWLAQSQINSEAPAPEDHGQPLAEVIAELQQERSRLSEALAASQAQAEVQFQTLAQTATAELAQARADLKAASEELSRERQRFAEDTAALIASAVARPAPVEAQPALAVSADPEAIKSAPPVPQPRKPAPPRPAVVTAPSPSATDVKPAPQSGGDVGWWGELQQLRRGLSKGGAKSTEQGGTAAAAAEERDLGNILHDCQSLQGELSGRPAKPISVTK